MNLRNFGKKVTTTSVECQTFINHELLQLYGYNHEEAIRCFEKALKFDKNCARPTTSLLMVTHPTTTIQMVWTSLLVLKNRKKHWKKHRTAMLLLLLVLCKTSQGV